MGPITPTLLETMDIRWELFPTETDAIGASLDRAIAHMDATGGSYALLMQKDSVAPHALAVGASLIKNRSTRSTAVIGLRDGAIEGRVSRTNALRQVIARTPCESTAVLSSTGFCGRELYAIEDRPNHLYMVGSMGCVALLALGLALARPDVRVIALDGDGAALMRMGAFATVGAYGPSNLQHLVLDNGVHDSTGGQATVSPCISFGQIAAACGYGAALETDDLESVGRWLDAPPVEGPRFARLLIRAGTSGNLPRPAVSPSDVRKRFMRHLRPTVEAR
jgi:phosphonopyruvate decarboxylase